MDQDETPLLIRHPLQLQQKAETLKPFVLANSPGQAQSKENTDSDSDTDLELMSVGSDDVQEEELPETQHIDPRPLSGLIVYVEVRSGTDSCENRQQAIAHQLELLGATVSQRLTKDVTHMVFKDGKQSVIEKAEKKGVYLVSPLWLDACKRANDRVSEAKYPVLNKDGSDSPVVLGRIKRIKSMQPKPLVEEITRSLERSRKRHRTNTPTKSATPVCSKAKPRENEGSSDEEDSYELPEINLPGTPLSKYGTATVTPEIGKRTPDKHVENAPTPEIGKASSKVATTTGTGKGSTKKNSKSTPSNALGKGSSKKKANNVCRLSSGNEEIATSKLPGRVSSSKKTNDRQQTSKKHAGHGSTPVQHLSMDVLTTSDSKTKLAAKSPLQTVCTNKKIKPEEDKEPKPKKRRVRAPGQSFEKQIPTIVLTSVHSSDQDTIHSIVDKLGQFRCAKTVCESTTHVVCGSPRRTVNVLSATLRGCWILSLDWVMKSLECGHWVAEEPYEMAVPFPAARHYRIQRQTSYITFQPELFKGCGSIFLSSGTAPPTQQLESLLALGGGKITTSHRKADVCVGCKSWSSAVKSVSEQWILDSISSHSLLSVVDYLLDSPLTREVSPEL